MPPDSSSCYPLEVLDESIIREVVIREIAEVELLRVFELCTRHGAHSKVEQVNANGDIGRPLSLQWDSMLFLWSTRDFEPKYRIYKMSKNRNKAKNFADDALNESLPDGCERRTSLEYSTFCFSAKLSHRAQPGDDSSFILRLVDRTRYHCRALAMYIYLASLSVQLK